MCGKRLCIGLALFSLSLPLYGQSFVDSKIYEVPGSKLNALAKDLLIAKTELEKQKGEVTRLSNLLKFSGQETERLKIWLKQSQDQVTQQTEQLRKLNLSYQALQNAQKTEGDNILTGILIGAGTVATLWLIIK